MKETSISTRRVPGISSVLLLVVATSVVFVCASRAQNGPESQMSNRTQRTGDTPQATPTPPKKDDDVTLNSDEVLRVDTSLTSIFFTAADKQKRFISSLKREDVRILEDGAPQEIFAFN